MITRDIREFMARDWAAVRDNKDAYWAERFRAEGFQPVWAAAQALLHHARSVNPGFPTEPDRERDWRDHDAMRTRLTAVAHAFPRR